MAEKCSTMEWIVWIIVTVAAINVGLDGAFDFDVLEMLFGEGTGAKVVSWVIGLSGLYAAYLMFKYSQKKK
jgi:uncharacterized membrane protein YuzA (DUF378 family)